MIACDRPLAFRWHTNRLCTWASLGYNKAAVQPSAEAGESGDTKRAIKR